MIRSLIFPMCHCPFDLRLKNSNSPQTELIQLISRKHLTKTFLVLDIPDYHGRSRVKPLRYIKSSAFCTASGASTSHHWHRHTCPWSFSQLVSALNLTLWCIDHGLPDTAVHRMITSFIPVTFGFFPEILFDTNRLLVCWRWCYRPIDLTLCLQKVI